MLISSGSNAEDSEVEEYRSSGFENRAVRKIIGSKIDEVNIT
jgi:hypothetical protein